MYSVWWFCFNYIQLLCGSNSYCSHHASYLINYKMAAPSSSGYMTVPHGIGNIGDKISSKESQDAHGNVHELPSEKRLLKVHATRITYNHVLL